MPLTFEYMTRETFGRYVCRAWHTDEISHSTLRPIAREAMREVEEFGGHIESVIQWIIAETGVSAVEIVDENGNGLCVYKDWP